MDVRPPSTQTLTTGALFRNANTDLVVVSLLNQDPNRSHTVTVSVTSFKYSFSSKILMIYFAL